MEFLGDLPDDRAHHFQPFREDVGLCGVAVDVQHGWFAVVGCAEAHDLCSVFAGALLGGHGQVDAVGARPLVVVSPHVERVGHEIPVCFVFRVGVFGG